MVNNKDVGPDRENGAGSSDGNLGEDGLEARRRQLATELATRSAEIAPPVENAERTQGYALAVKLSSEFIAGVLVGAALGYLLDRLAGTTPWGMIVFLLLGFCAGVLNVMRSTGSVSTPQPGVRTSRDDQDANN